MKVLRGGSWVSFVPSGMRGALRNGDEPGQSYDDVGFRITNKGGRTMKAGIEMVEIPGGEFTMGSPENEPGRWDDETQHQVKVKPFRLAKYLVTNAQYAEYLKAHPEVRKPSYWDDKRFNQPQQPVVGVTWDEAQAFAKWAGGRLPTEEEWEYACRAGTTGPRYDDDLDAIAWYDKNSGGTTQPVGQKKPNQFGLYDMLGNVWEWCQDVYAPYKVG